MNEYRLTRPNRYGGENLAKTDKSIRQGYYIVASDEADAHKQMKTMFPNDSHFDLELWKKDVSPHREDA